MTLVFWTLLFLLFYAYLGYPLCLRLLALFRTASVPPRFSQAYLPSVTLIVSAHNEQEVIAEKLRNALELDYPQGKLEIVVASDGSTDATDAIVRQYAGKGVRLVRCEGRIGKTACLNEVVPGARGDIVVFSDANSFYDRSAIVHLAARFADPSVGFVTGHTMYSIRGGNSGLAPIGLYGRLETWVKSLESRVGSCVGADGAIFAVRKDLYRPLAPDEINDLVIPLKIVEQGYRGVLEERAFCTERTGDSPAEEYARQVRIAARSIKALLENTHLLNPFKYPLFAWQVASHKLTRLSMPFLLLLLALTSLDLALRGHGILYTAALASQGLFYGLAAAGPLCRGQGKTAKIVSMAHLFVAVHIAVLVGWIKYFRGERYTAWNSHRQMAHVSQAGSPAVHPESDRLGSSLPKQR